MRIRCEERKSRANVGKEKKTMRDLTTTDRKPSAEQTPLRRIGVAF